MIYTTTSVNAILAMKQNRLSIAIHSISFMRSFQYYCGLLSHKKYYKVGILGESFAINQLSSRAATPGRVFPSSNSNEAPPPVEMWLKRGVEISYYLSLTS